MTKAHYSLTDDWGAEHKHRPEGCACQYCGAPTDAGGLHHEPNTFDAAAAVRHLLLLVWDFPQQAVALAGALTQKSGEDIADRLEALTGRRPTRQAAYEHKLVLRNKFPELAALLFRQKGFTTNERRASAKPQKRVGQCLSCGEMTAGDYCAKCMPEAAPVARGRKRGVFYN